MIPVSTASLFRAGLLLALGGPPDATPPQPPAPSPDDQARRIAELESNQAELERRLDLLGRELERFSLGDVAPPVGDRYFGLGPAASKVYGVDSGLSIGGYGEVVYQNLRGNGDEFDALRAVLYVGYRFTEKWVLNTEIEIEHASEIGLEFATLDYLHDPRLNFRAGLVLVPMGFVNELHEPTTFWSARRPDVESFILPSTWRENGVGLFGDVGDFSYRAYVVNGFDGSAFRSSNGLRGGRQKGAQADADDVAGVARVDWQGVAGLLAGGSYYVGDSGQDSGFDGRVSVAEAHVEGRWKGLRARGLWAKASVDDVLGLAQAGGLVNGMGVLQPGVSANAAIGGELEGGYLELGYDVLSTIESKQSLVPFARWEVYDLQRGEVPTPFLSDGSRDVRVLTFGVAWFPIPSIVFKADFQDYDNEAGTGIDQLNLSAGYIF